MNLRGTCIAVVTLLALACAPALCQQTLGGLVAEGGFEWMIGTWQASGDGQEMQISYKWELNRHAVMVHFKMGDYEYRGMIFYVAHEDKIMQVGADNQGGTSKALWEAAGDKAISKSEGASATGDKIKMGITHQKVDANTMKAEVYGINDAGELADAPFVTLEYKRKAQKAQTR